MITVDMFLKSAISFMNDGMLARVIITNDGMGTQRKANYDYQLIGKHGRCIKRGRIVDWPRQSKTPLALLQAILNHAYPEAK